MNDADFDTALAAWLAPPQRPADRMFAARVDTAISDLALLHAAERRYARGFIRELVALGAVAVAGVIMALWSGLAVNDWMIGAPVALLMLVLLNPQPDRRPRPDISVPDSVGA